MFGKCIAGPIAPRCKGFVSRHDKQCDFIPQLSFGEFLVVVLGMQQELQNRFVVCLFLHIPQNHIGSSMKGLTDPPGFGMKVSLQSSESEHAQTHPEKVWTQGRTMKTGYQGILRERLVIIFVAPCSDPFNAMEVMIKTHFPNHVQGNGRKMIRYIQFFGGSCSFPSLHQFFCHGGHGLIQSVFQECHLEGGLQDASMSYPCGTIQCRQPSSDGAL
mmetsp:Transcript_5790/g.12870  ORF Transcript_5790/g.12870 Transcript_5790/m.12870 type:complete len:216 (+) Transcript_5790:949-1596(+)